LAAGSAGVARERGNANEQQAKSRLVSSPLKPFPLQRDERHHPRGKWIVDHVPRAWRSQQTLEIDDRHKE